MENNQLNIYLSKHISLKMLIQSGVALRHNINNTPTTEQIERLRQLAVHVLEPLWRAFGVLRITSGFRCKELNAHVGGVYNSQHLYGEAADIHLSNLNMGYKMLKYIKENLVFDQALLENKQANGCCWLHVSYKSDRGVNRKECLEIN